MMVWKIESILHAICLIAVILTDTRKAEKTEDIENSAQRLFFVESERPEKNEHIIDTCRGRCDASKRQPICGSDRRVYDNLCQLLEANCRNNVNQTEWETCRGLHYLCPRKCLEIQDPVCGDDNNLYPNLCVMHRRNCGKKISTQPLKYCFARAREFRSFDPCPDNCLDVYKPVCGSNGIVYLNECYLRKHTCGQNVQMVKISQCVLVRKCPQICIALYDPVCGSDGKMYLNYCRMLKENCGIEIKRMSRKFCDKRERNLTS